MAEARVSRLSVEALTSGTGLRVSRVSVEVLASLPLSPGRRKKFEWLHRTQGLVAGTPDNERHAEEHDRELENYLREMLG